MSNRWMDRLLEAVQKKAISAFESHRVNNAAMSVRKDENGNLTGLQSSKEDGYALEHAATDPGGGGPTVLALAREEGITLHAAATQLKAEGGFPKIEKHTLYENGQCAFLANHPGCIGLYNQMVNDKWTKTEALNFIRNDEDIAGIMKDEGLIRRRRVRK